MSFGPEISTDLLSCCQQATAEIAEALARAFDGNYVVEVGEPASIVANQLPDDFDSPGFVVAMLRADQAVLVVLPAANSIFSGLEETDVVDQSRIDALGRELSVSLLPESLKAEEVLAARCEHIGQAIARAELGSEVIRMPVAVQRGDDRVTMSIVWPASAARRIFATGETPSEQSPSKKNDLAAFSRSLLKISVPVAVTLAADRQPLARILEIRPGSIIQFKKLCEETLSLEVGNQTLAEGEAVKVNDRFGLRITAMATPDERFYTVTDSE